MVIPHPNPGRVNCSSEVKPGVVTGQALVDLLNYAKDSANPTASRNTEHGERP